MVDALTLGGPFAKTKRVSLSMADSPPSSSITRSRILYELALVYARLVEGVVVDASNPSLGPVCVAVEVPVVVVDRAVRSRWSPRH